VINVGEILFAKIIPPEEVLDAAAGGAKPIKPAAGVKKGPEVDIEDHTIDFTKAEIRVGVITKVWNHPSAERLFCEEIDVGEATGPRQVCDKIYVLNCSRLMLIDGGKLRYILFFHSLV
jgi:hypothetical protein